MKKLLLLTAAVLCVAASIFGGYYFYVTNDLQETEIQQEHLREETKGNEATDEGIAYEYRSSAWREEDGSINPDGLANAIAQRDYYLAQHLATDGFGNNGMARLPQQFSPIGPQNLGGRTEAILVNPSDPTVVWAGGASGGVWKSYDGGNTWNAMNGVLGNFNVSCLALDPGDAAGDILYAGTGTANSVNGDGIYKSTDGGMNWVRLSVTHENRWREVSSIAVANTTGNPENTVILAAMESDSRLPQADHGIMRSVDGGMTWARVKNDVSFGVAVGFDPNNPAIAIASTCNNPDPGDPNDEGKCKAWYSNNGGQTWSPSSLDASPFESPRARDSIHFAFFGSEIYAQFGDVLPTVMSKSTNGGISFSTQGLQGNPEGINRGVPAFWVNAYHQFAPIIITGGANLFRSINGVMDNKPIGGSVAPLPNPPYPHVDMQTVVTDLSDSTNRSVFVGTDGGIFHTDDVVHATGLHVPVPSGTPSGVPTPDVTPSGWTVLNNKLQNTQYFTVSGDAGSGPTPGPPIIFGGTQDNGSLRLVGGSTDTAALIYGDGGLSAVDGTDCFGQDTTRRISRFRNCANTLPRIPVAHEGNISDWVGGVPLSPFPFIIDSTPNRAFLGIKGVWRTLDLKSAGPHWSRIKPNLGITASPTPTATVTPTGTPSATPTPRMFRPKITAMAVAPSDSNYMWVAEFYPDLVGLGYRHLYRTTNSLVGIPTDLPDGEPSPIELSPTPTGTPTATRTPTNTATPTAQPTWTEVGENVLPNRTITKILIDPDSASDEIVYVAFGGFARDNLWRTVNQGDNWEDISGGSPAGTCLPNDPLGTGLPCAPIRAIARHPRDPNTLYVGTEIGLYATTNLNEANPQNIQWAPVSHGPANVMISDLQFMKHSNVLLAGTWGRGVWATDFGPGPSPSPPIIKAINDFDGDGRSDIAVVRADGAQLVWHKDGSTEGYGSAQFGAAGDQLAAADYDGDGKADRAVYRASEQRWYSWMSSTNSLEATALGEYNDKEVPADFDGDGVADEAVFKPSTGYWEVQQSTNGHYTLQWGAPGDKPVTVDFTGDGKADYGVLHEEQGMQILNYYDGTTARQKQFGLEGDIPVSGNYDGDNKADIAFWRPDDDGEGNGCWYITYAENGYEGYDAIPWGENGDIPVPGDYDGDGKMDVAVFRPSTGFWHILESSNGYFSQLFGAAGDIPVGAKTTSYSARPGQTYQKAPSWAEPRRRSRLADAPNAAAAD